MEWIPFVLLGIIILFLVLQLSLWFGTRRLEGKPAPDVSDILGERAKQLNKLLFYFYSPHCGPCRRMTPHIDRLSQNHDNIVKIDISQDHDISHRFGVTVVPTTLVVSDGKVTKALVGRQSERQLEALLD